MEKLSFERASKYLLVFLAALAMPTSLCLAQPPTNSLTNGYQFTVIKPVAAPEFQKLCAKVLLVPSSIVTESQQQRQALLRKVLTDWYSRGDYRAESLAKLEEFESQLDPQRTTWLHYSNENSSATLRYFDGTYVPYVDGVAFVGRSRTMALPVEIKFPKLKIRRNAKQAIFELGLMDVTTGVTKGVESLFHQVAKNLKRDYLDSNYFAELENSLAEKNIDPQDKYPVIVATSREANSRLYQSKYGFSPRLEDGQPQITADGMHVLEISVAYFIARFFGKRIYPVNRHQEDFWGAFRLQQNERIRTVEAYGDKVANQIHKLTVGFKAPLEYRNEVISVINATYDKVQRAREALDREDFGALEMLLSEISRDIYRIEPVVQQSSIPGMRIGSGFFSWAWQGSEIQTWTYRYEDHLYKMQRMMESN